MRVFIALNMILLGTKIFCHVVDIGTDNVEAKQDMNDRNPIPDWNINEQIRESDEKYQNEHEKNHE